MIAQIEEFLNVKKLDKSNCTITSYQSSIDRFLKFFNIQSFDDIVKINIADCRKYQSYLLESGLKKSSVNAFIRPLQVLFNFFVDSEYLKNNAWERVKSLKTPKTIPAFLSNEEITSMINACKKPDDKIILALLLTTGLRRNELVSLKISDIDDCHIIVNGKGSKQRQLMVQPEVCKLLNEYLEYRNKKYGNTVPYFLISKMGTQYSGEAIRQRIHTIGKRAGLNNERLAEIHTHSMRHTFCANMIESGADIRVIQGAMGHSNISTTQIYAHLRNEVLDKAMLNQRSILATA